MHYGADEPGLDSVARPASQKHADQGSYHYWSSDTSHRPVLIMNLFASCCV